MVNSEKKKTVIVTKAANKKTIVIPATVGINGETYKVTGIKAKAFAGSGAKTIIVKTKYLTKTSVKNSLKGSKVKAVKVKVGSKKIFTKKNCSKRCGADHERNRT